MTRHIDFEGIENFREAVTFLFTGIFRGYAHLEKHYRGGDLVERLEPVELGVGHREQVAQHLARVLTEARRARRGSGRLADAARERGFRAGPSRARAAFWWPLRA